MLGVECKASQVSEMPVARRDAVPNILLARYYSNGLGRFLSVDPVVKRRANSRIPQRWNRYSYALNNPVKYVDPDGKDIYNRAEDPVIRARADRLSSTPTIQRLYGPGSGRNLYIHSLWIPKSRVNPGGEAQTEVEVTPEGKVVNATITVDPNNNDGTPKSDQNKIEHTDHEFGEASLAAQGLSPENDDVPTAEGERLEEEASQRDNDDANDGGEASQDDALPNPEKDKDGAP